MLVRVGHGRKLHEERPVALTQQEMAQALQLIVALKKADAMKLLAMVERRRTPNAPVKVVA